MRSAKQAENFPYCMSTVCYFSVDDAGNVTQLPHKNKSDRPRLMEFYEKARNGLLSLYAVWPGNWSSDLFSIDDLDAFAEAFEFSR